MVKKDTLLRIKQTIRISKKNPSLMAHLTSRYEKSIIASLHLKEKTSNSNDLAKHTILTKKPCVNILEMGKLLQKIFPEDNYFLVVQVFQQENLYNIISPKMHIALT